jgi:hypothetical protein
LQKKKYLKAKGTKRRQTPITRAKQLENIIVIRWVITNSIQPQPYQRPPKLKLYFHSLGSFGFASNYVVIPTSHIQSSSPT